MIPADPDTKLVWSCFVIAQHLEGVGVSDIVARSRHEHMPMTRADVLKILRRYVDLFDKDVRFTKEKSS
jgi:hypothetical protein